MILICLFIIILSSLHHSCRFRLQFLFLFPQTPAFFLQRLYFFSGILGKRKNIIQFSLDFRDGSNRLIIFMLLFPFTSLACFEAFLNIRQTKAELDRKSVV